MTHEEAGTVFLVILRFLIEDLRTQEPRLDFPLFFYLQVLLSLEEKRKCGMCSWYQGKVFTVSVLRHTILTRQTPHSNRDHSRIVERIYMVGDLSIQ